MSRHLEIEQYADKHGVSNKQAKKALGMKRSKNSFTSQQSAPRPELQMSAAPVSPVSEAPAGAATSQPLAAAAAPQTK